MENGSGSQNKGISSEKLKTEALERQKIRSDLFKHEMTLVYLLVKEEQLFKKLVNGEARVDWFKKAKSAKITNMSEETWDKILRNVFSLTQSMKFMARVAKIKDIQNDTLESIMAHKVQLHGAVITDVSFKTAFPIQNVKAVLTSFDFQKMPTSSFEIRKGSLEVSKINTPVIEKTKIETVGAIEAPFRRAKVSAIFSGRYPIMNGKITIEKAKMLSVEDQSRKIENWPTVSKYLLKPYEKIVWPNVVRPVEGVIRSAEITDISMPGQDAILTSNVCMVRPKTTAYMKIRPTVFVGKGKVKTACLSKIVGPSVTVEPFESDWPHLEPQTVSAPINKIEIDGAKKVDAKLTWPDSTTIASVKTLQVGVEKARLPVITGVRSTVSTVKVKLGKTAWPTVSSEEMHIVPRQRSVLRNPIIRVLEKPQETLNVNAAATYYADRLVALSKQFEKLMQAMENVKRPETTVEREGKEASVIFSPDFMLMWEEIGGMTALREDKYNLVRR